MEKIATEEIVFAACDQFLVEGRKITSRGVLKEVGGSLSTVARYIKVWRKQYDNTTSLATDIPVELLTSIRKALNHNTAIASESLRVKAEEAENREDEVIVALEECESRIASLESELQGARNINIQLQQHHDKELAVSAETIRGLREHVTKLELEKDQLHRSGEPVRTELASIQIELKRADQFSEKSEARNREIEDRALEMAKSKAETEKRMAVAESRVHDLLEQLNKSEMRLSDTGLKIAEFETKCANLIREISTLEASLRKAEGIGEQMTIRLQESAAINDKLHKDTESERERITRTLSAAESAQLKAEGANEQMLIRIQESAATIDQLSKELNIVRKESYVITELASNGKSSEQIIEETFQDLKNQQNILLAAKRHS